MAWSSRQQQKSSPYLAGENIIRPPVGGFFGHLEFLLQAFDDFWVVLLQDLELLLALGLEGAEGSDLLELGEAGAFHVLTAETGGGEGS